MAPQIEPRLHVCGFRGIRKRYPIAHTTISHTPIVTGLPLSMAMIW